MTIYAVALSKGGSTKTTTAAELVAALARRGRRVLAIDLDQQGNLTTRLGVTDDTEVSAVAADVLTAEATAPEAAIDSPSVPGASILAGTHDLASLDQRPEVITALRDHLPEVAGEWDDVVIDTPPALGRVTAPVREAVAARDAYTSGMPVSVFAPGSPIAADYAAALAPIIGTPEPDAQGERQAPRHRLTTSTNQTKETR